ncbi:sodium:proton antiporter [Bowdeniella nasicola]|uniref:Sodium:proton antiporter n=1 Tax=Bowdeniella nasicola TaxID=208480 RepID=A0A1Q5Q3R1_9ACTO|nr:dicarboxylate/amino acid:cation symporter [Bowdeniella nasicola]OKL54456.1 sodium:proton antiporter [Bowdeniella nasicola]
MAKEFRIGLLPRIGIAIVAGILIGLFAPDWLTRIFVTFNVVFGQFLSFAIPLIIVGLITPAIASLGRGAGKWLGITAGIAYLSTLLAGLLALVVGVLVYPYILSVGNIEDQGNPEDALLAPFFKLEMPPVFSVMTALVLAFVLGVGLTITKGRALYDATVEFREIINKVISTIIIPLLPIYIFGIILNMTVAGEVFRVIGTFLSIIVLVFALTLVVLLVQYTIAGVMNKKNPLVMLKTMLPAYVTALGTSSSAATIPVTLRQAMKMGVSEPVAYFVVPLCATVHLAGSTLKITSFALAIMYISGIEINIGLMIGFVFMLGITMVAAPGVPGGAIVAASGLLTSMLGFTEPQVGLMIATYIAIDSFGTATNVTGDGALAAIVDKLSAGRFGSPRPVVIDRVSTDGEAEA